jgi:hypothetical protein
MHGTTRFDVVVAQQADGMHGAAQTDAHKGGVKHIMHVAWDMY